MEFSFENMGTNTYLVYEIKETDELDSLSLGMLTNNHIPGLAPASFMQMDTTKYIKYNVSAKVSVQQLFSGPVNKKRLVGVFLGVVEAMLAAEEYMLDPNTILLNTDYIFADVSTCETEMVCLPVMGLQNPTDLTMFFKNILFTTQFDQTENCDHVAQMINYLNNNTTLMLEDFRDMLKGLTENHRPAPAPAPAPQSAPQPAPRPVQPAPAPAPAPQSVPVAQPAPAPHPAPQPVAVPKAPAAVNVPKAPAPAAPKAAAPAQPAAGEKEMSWFYLMQHYNAENAAIYKAQQEAKKAKKGAPAAPAAPAKPAKAAKPAAPAKAAPAAGFAIPGQNAAPAAGFAIPGQNAAPAAGFAIPGQPTPVQPAAPKAQPAVPQPAPRPAAPVAQPAPAPVPAPQSVPAQPAAPQGKPLNFGETTVLSAGIGETTVLSAAMENKVQNDPHLIRAKNNEKIPLNKPVFRIGKERSYVDYFIGDNTAISRGHANVVNHNGEFFVVDTNSTNHTYVNGGMIQSGVETKLSHGDKIRLANEDFEFKLY